MLAIVSKGRVMQNLGLFLGKNKTKQECSAKSSTGHVIS